MVTYGTTVIPSDQITVQSGGTVAISAAFENSIGLIGGMDTGTGTASTGSVISVDSPSDAQNKFGDGSELHEAAKLAYANGAADVTALPLPENTVTDEAQTTATGSVDNAPIFDPNVNNEHAIAVDDTTGGALTVEITYESPPSQPTDTDTVAVNPVTGEYAADAAPAGTEYQFDYDYPTIDSGTLVPMVDESPRIISFLTENESALSTLVTEVKDNATDFDFMQVVGGAAPANIAGTTATSTEANTYASNYSDGLDERRLSVVASPRAYIDAANTDMQRTASAVGGYLASIPLGISSTNDSISGISGDLRTPLKPSNAGDLINAQVLPLIDYPPITIAKDMTTSQDTKFERVYVNQVVDEATEVSHFINRQFVGDQNTATARSNLSTSHRNAYNAFVSGVPKLLDDFTVSVAEDGTDPNKVNVEIGLDVVDVIDTIDVTITVGDIIRNTGAE